MGAERRSRLLFISDDDLLSYDRLEVVLNIFDEISAENQNIVEPDNYGGFLNGWT